MEPKKAQAKITRGQFKYSEIAIEAAAYIKAALHMPYRETQGCLISILNLIDISLPVPNYTTICRRIAKLDLPQVYNITDDKNINIVVDSTGLKIFGAGIYHEEKHGLKMRRQWRKLHLTVHDKAGSNVTIAIPPLKNVIVHDDKSNDFGSRNHNVAYIDEHYSYCWQSYSKSKWSLKS